MREASREASGGTPREALLLGEGARQLLSALGGEGALGESAEARAWPLPTSAPGPSGRWSLLTTLCGVTRSEAWVWAYPIAQLLQGAPSALERDALALARALGGRAGVLWLTPSPRLTSIERFEAPERARRLLSGLGVSMGEVRVLLPPPDGASASELAQRLSGALTRAAEGGGAAPARPPRSLSPSLTAQALDLIPIAPGRAEGFEGQEWRAERPFALAQTLVTHALAEVLLGRGPARPPAPAEAAPLPAWTPPAPETPPLTPAARLSWLDAARLCNALSRALGLSPHYAFERAGAAGVSAAGGDEPSNTAFEAGDWRVLVNPAGEHSFRLPTSAEWCYAAAAGLPTAYAGGDRVDEVAWSAQNSGSKLHAVASLSPNRWGLYDMSGLLWEWCEDGARDAEASAGDGRVRCVSPRQPKWLLGGSWANHPWVFPIGERLAELPTYADDFMGVRLARTLPPHAPALTFGDGGVSLRPGRSEGSP
jgi:formylglycine-generating enzyme required for sulfatase activity